MFQLGSGREVEYGRYVRSLGESCRGGVLGAIPIGASARSPLRMEVLEPLVRLIKSCRREKGKNDALLIEMPSFGSKGDSTSRSLIPVRSHPIRTLSTGFFT